MHKLRKFGLWGVAAAVILACGLLPAPVAPMADVSTIVAATLHAIGGSTPGAASTGAPAGVAASCRGVSLMIPSGLASGATSENVPAVTDQTGAPWEVSPAYTRCTLQAYPLQGKFFGPQIIVYPAHEYAAASTGAATSIQRLQAILASASPQLSNNLLPRLPFANADQIVGAQPKVISFNGGSGVRVLAEYAQYFAPINNHELFYHLEALTSDGKTYVVATLPINASFLAGDSDPAASIPSDGIPFPGTSTTDPNVFASYYQSLTSKLNTTSPGAFQPTLTALDALIASISAQ